MTPEEIRDREDLRALVAEAHGATKDLRAEVKNARTALDAMRAEVADLFAEHATHVVRSGLAEYQTAIQVKIDEATAAVFKRFDTLADTLLGEDRQSRRKGRPSIATLLAERRQ